MRFLRKNWIHIVVWGLMIVYLFVSPLIEEKYFLHQGKPVALDAVSAVETSQLRYSIDKISEVKTQGEKVYKLNGWSFLPSAQSLTDHDVFIAVTVQGKLVYYPVVAGKRRDVVSAFPEVTFDLLFSGFSCNIAKETISQGSHAIGILYRHKATGETLYQETGYKLVRTPNTLALLLPEGAE
jgi:hypothetical protein